MFRLFHGHGSNAYCFLPPRTRKSPRNARDIFCSVEVGTMKSRPSPILRASLRRIVPVRYSDRTRGTGTKPFLSYSLFNSLHGRAKSELVDYSARTFCYEHQKIRTSLGDRAVRRVRRRTRNQTYRSMETSRLKEYSLQVFCLRFCSGQQTSTASHVSQRSDRQSRSPPDRRRMNTPPMSANELLLFIFHHTLNIAGRFTFLNVFTPINICFSFNDRNTHL